MNGLHKLILLLLVLGTQTVLYSQWINEIHYHNSGTDESEGVGIIAPSGTDLSCYSVELYNQAGTNYDTEVLSGIVGDEGCGYGEIWFDIPGIQNGPNDGIALVYNNSGSCTDVTSIIQLLSYQGTFTGDTGTTADGLTSTDIGVFETSSTLSTQSLQLSGTGASYTDFSWTYNTASSHDAINGSQFISPCNTVTPGTISGGPFSVGCATSTRDSGSIAFTSSGTFNTGNTYTVQLSDASGSFNAPINIGTLESTSNAGSISFTIPYGLETGNYRIRIVSSTPLLTGSESADFLITQNNPCPFAEPHLTSVIINSCAFGSCPEGDNEILFGNTGSSIVTMNTSNFEMTYGSNVNPTQTYSDPQVDNSSTTDALNIETGCSGTFIDANNTTIPPFSSFMLVHNDICPGALDWEALCSAANGQIYIIYSADDTWSDQGNYGNGNSSTPAGTFRFFETTIIDTDGNSNSISYSYDIADLDSHADGDYILFNDDGGLASAYGNNGCTIDPVVLSSEVVNFYSENVQDDVVLYWHSSSETDNDYYTIYHSTNGAEWTSIGNTPGNGTTLSESNYQIIHDRPQSGLNYYRLHSTDYDGTTYTKSTIAVKTDINFAYYNAVNNTIELEEETNLEIYSTDGRLVYKNFEAKTVQLESQGMFIIVDLETSKTMRIMVH